MGNAGRGEKLLVARSPPRRVRVTDEEAIAAYGVNGSAVRDRLELIETIKWFNNVGKPHPDDGTVERLGHGGPEIEIGYETAPESGLNECWIRAGGNAWDALVEAAKAAGRQPVWRRVLTDWEARACVKHRGIVVPNRRFVGACDTMDIDFSTACEAPRHLCGATLEAMLADVRPDLTFFSILLPWYAAGHWPCGWHGEYPHGKLVVF